MVSLKRAYDHPANEFAAHFQKLFFNKILFCKFEFNISFSFGSVWQLYCHRDSAAVTFRRAFLVLPPLPKVLDLFEDLYGVRAKKQLGQNFILDQNENITGMYTNFYASFMYM